MTLLVTTAIEKTWKTTDEILFLGEWCKIYDRKENWANLNYRVHSFHWDDRKKFNKDYAYLTVLHDRILSSLTASLNDYHNVDYTKRYWQILLDPWLMSYVSVMFDHWECIRTVLDDEINLTTILPDNGHSISPPYSYSEFITEILSDRWHYLMFSKIIDWYYKDKCTLIKKKIFIKEKKVIHKNAKRNWIKLIAGGVDRILGMMHKKCDVVFLDSYFKFFSLIKISFMIGQVPRFYINEFYSLDIINKKTASKDLRKDRSDLNINIESKTRFEQFIFNELSRSIPVSVLEGYQSLVFNVKKIMINPKVIVTANSHWNNIAAKVWMADRINHNSKLVILEHGGSLPTFKEFFNFEEDISDIKVTWFLPYHKKHTRLPPSRLVSIMGWWAHKSYDNYFRKNCSLIGQEIPRYVYRACFYPMAGQSNLIFNSTVEFYDNLSADVRKHFFVKPNVNYGWNTRARYEELLGVDSVYSNISMSSIYNKSKVIVCTYPQTTFSEAMASGIPTIMFYDKELNERNAVVDKLLEVLSESKIVFFDPVEAALHLNSIWDNAFQWWNSPDILLARSEFKKSALDLDTGWAEKWKSFLNSF